MFKYSSNESKKNFKIIISFLTKYSSIKSQWEFQANKFVVVARDILEKSNHEI